MHDNICLRKWRLVRVRGGADSDVRKAAWQVASGVPAFLVRANTRKEGQMLGEMPGRFFGWSRGTSSRTWTPNIFKQVRSRLAMLLYPCLKSIQMLTASHMLLLNPHMQVLARQKSKARGATICRAWVLTSVREATSHKESSAASGERARDGASDTRPPWRCREQ